LTASRDTRLRRRVPWEAGAYVLSPLLALLAWEALARSGAVDPRFYGQPSQIAVAGWELAQSGALAEDLLASLGRISAGFVLGAVPGVIIGALMGLSAWFRLALTPLVAATFPIPKIALLPLLLVAFGIGETSKIMLVAIGVFFIALYNTMGGVLNLPHTYRDIATSFGAGRYQYVRMVALPGALPHIFTGLKLSVGIALLLIVAAEFVGADSGIGQLVWSSWQVFAVDQMFVGLIVLSILGFLTNSAMEYLEARLLPWR
jgi:NitT/TauT family transport system permease protein